MSLSFEILLINLFMTEFLSFLQTSRPIIHLILHLLVPFLLAQFSSKPKRVFLIMIATMLVDLDHLFANPLYDPSRCSIGFHPLHTIYIQPLYVLLCFYPKTKWIGVGLVIHMVLDLFDCIWMKSF